MHTPINTPLHSHIQTLSLTRNLNLKDVILILPHTSISNLNFSILLIIFISDHVCIFPYLSISFHTYTNMSTVHSSIPFLPSKYTPPAPSHHPLVLQPILHPYLSLYCIVQNATKHD